jgi:ABC-type bacteriocin/lantibiotic exporter with double-glycine peptidase domain
MFPYDLGQAFHELRERLTRLPDHPLLRRETYDRHAVVLGSSISDPDEGDFPRFMQLDNYSCSVATTRSVLMYYGMDLLEHELRWLLEVDPKKGADEKAIAKVLRLRGRRPRMKHNMTLKGLRMQIDAGKPVIVCLDDSAHWAVVYGYSRTGFYVMDPSPKCLLKTHFSTKAFRRRWDRWGMLVE